VTAACFILTGLSLLLTGNEKSSAGFLRLFFPLLVLVAGCLRLIDFIFPVQLSIDLALYGPEVLKQTVQGRMESGPAFNFILAGAAILFLNGKKTILYAQICALVLLSFSLLPLVNYLYSTPVSLRWDFTTYMAFNTTLSFLLVSLCILFVKPGNGIMALWSGKGVGSIMIRRLLPIILFTLILLGFLRQLGLNAGYYSAEFGTAFLLVFTIILLSGLIGINGFYLNNIEFHRTKSEEKYKKLIDEVGDVLYTSDFKGHFMFLNERVFKLTGFRSEELIGRHFTEIIEDGWKMRTAEFYKKQFSERIPETIFILPIVTKSGNVKWVEQTVSTIEENGLIQGFQCVVRDVTERKEMEAKLFERDTQIQTIFQNAPDAVILIDEEGVIEKWNPKAEELFGWVEKDITGKHLHKTIIPQRFREAYRFGLKDFLNTMSEPALKKPLELTVVNKDNIEFEVSLSISPTVSNGKHLFIGFIRDITAKKKFENILRKSEARLSEAQKIGHIGNWEYDMQSNELFWSNELFRILGKDPESFSPTYNGFLSCIHEEDVEAVKNSIRKAEDGNSFNINFRIRIQENILKFVRGEGYILFDAAGNPKKQIGILQDITSQKIVERELIHASQTAVEAKKAKDLFLANMSHEIRTPINAIIGFSKLLSETRLSEKQLEYLNPIIYSADNLIVIINDILDFSKIEAGKIEFEKIAFSLPELIDSIRKIFKVKAKEKNIRLSISIDSRIPAELTGDPTRLSQILSNLVSNGIKFSRPNGSVRISADYVPESYRDDNSNTARVQFRVMDTGIGISADKIKTIFDSFTQAKAETTRIYGGTGLGLTIVKQLIELQGGKIEVQSTEDEGSLFSFDLKFGKAAKSEEESIDALIPENSVYLPNLKVLLVEDNPINQKLTSIILRGWKFDVDIAENGKIAIDKMNAKDYDLILMDIQMPEMDGYETTQYVRHVLNNESIPIMAMTAHAFSGELEKCLDAGMNDYLTKPFEPAVLYSKIATLMKPEFQKEVKR
ncbi:MAG TPA: PAS domain S-box protein, partial [Bacteroidia bacterium]|nr:PAS domain S-box protein [Bacteroidia bacterium]